MSAILRYSCHREPVSAGSCLGAVIWIKAVWLTGRIATRLRHRVDRFASLDSLSVAARPANEVSVKGGGNHAHQRPSKGRQADAVALNLDQPLAREPGQDRALRRKTGYGF